MLMSPLPAHGNDGCRLCALLVLVISMVPRLAGAGQPDESPDPREILRQAQAAAQSIRALRFTGTNEGLGSSSGRLRSEGRLIATRLDEPGDLHNRVRGEVTRFYYDRSPQIVTCSFDGQSIWNLNPEEHLLYEGDPAERMDRMVLLTPFYLCSIFEVLRPDRFNALIEAGTVEYEGQTFVGEVFCHVVFVDQSADEPAGPTTRWAIGVDDLVPRRKETWRTTFDRPGLMATEIHDLEINPAIDDTVFTLEAPEGYRTEVYSLRPGSPAPAWDAVDMDERKVNLEQFRGRVVILDFWATWCVPCRGVMKDLQKIHERFDGNEVSVIGVDVWEQDPDAEPAEFARSLGCTYDIIRGSMAMTHAYRVEGLPTLVMIGADGRILRREVGAHADLNERLIPLIEDHLKERVNPEEPDTPPNDG